MPLPEEIRPELEAMRLRLLELLVPLQRREGEKGRDDDESLRRGLWAAARGLEALLRDAGVPADLDLTRDDPATRQILLEHVTWEYFLPHALEDPGDVDVPAYTPEECGLRVFFDHGRWFVSWMKLEEDMSRPEAMTRELLVFDRDRHGRLVFTEV